LSSLGWQNSGLWDSENGGRIRVLGTRILREVWVADFGGFGDEFCTVLLDFAGFLLGFLGLGFGLVLRRLIAGRFCVLIRFGILRRQ